MWMNFAEIRALASRLLDDPQQTVFDATAVGQWANIAYQMVVDEVDLSPHPWRVLPDAEAIVLKPTSGVTEYNLGEPARRVTEVREYLSANRFCTVDMVPFSERHERPNGVYWFGHATTGLTWLGICGEPTQYQELRIYRLPILAPLKQDGDYPMAVPPEAFEMIAIGAALTAKITEGRESDGLAALWANRAEALRRRLAAHTRSYSATKILR